VEAADGGEVMPAISFKLNIKTANQLGELVNSIRNLGYASKNKGSLKRAMKDEDKTNRLLWDMQDISALLWPLLSADIEIEASVETTEPQKPERTIQ
jgi:hypothetical protein